MVLSPTNKFLGATIGGDLAPSLGERKRNFADQDFSMKYFYKKNSIFTQKISDDPFFVIDHVFQIFNIFTLLNVLYYDPFFTTKTLISQNNSLMMWRTPPERRLLACRRRLHPISTSGAD